MELREAVVVVTGASSGIGWATAWAFAREGSAVVVAARREERLHQLVHEIERRGGRAIAQKWDVDRREEIEELRDRVQNVFGRCDVLINNAGIPGGGQFADVSMDGVEAVVRTNLLGVLLTAKAFLPMMLEAGRGHMVNIASLAGRFAVPGSAVYSATKHAVVAFSEAAYYELAPRGILVTAVNPGLVATEGFPQREAVERGQRVMRPERIARIIVRVVQKGIAPEISIPRSLAALQAVRVLTPPLYRFGLSQFSRRYGRIGPRHPSRAGPT